MRRTKPFFVHEQSPEPVEPHVATYYVMLVATVFAAHWRGKSCEKAGAWIALSGSLFTSTVAWGGIWEAFAVPVFIIDLMVLAGFWSLALFSSRFWPYWATGWQLVGLLVHIQRLMFDDILEKPYGLLSMYISYPILLVILLSSLQTQTVANVQGNLSRR
jgi:hypothetical protein